MRRKFEMPYGSDLYAVAMIRSHLNVCTKIMKYSLAQEDC